MKTQVVSLQGREFVISTAGAEPLNAHLKTVRKATFLQKQAYRENVEALRDILSEQNNNRPISKATIMNAIRLVGVPEKHPLSKTLDDFLRKLRPSLVQAAIYVKAKFKLLAKHWRRLIIVILAIGTSLASAGHGFFAYGLLQSEHSNVTGKWQSIETNIGRVRTYSEPVPPNVADNWLLGWQSYLLLALLFLAVAIFLLLLLRAKRRLLLVLLILVSAFVAGIMMQAQRQIMSFVTANPTAVNFAAQPLKPRLAYLQQCGDEIPYVFDNQTAGMQFRQLRDDGFVLATELPTNYGQPDLKQLCIAYDKLRQTHAKNTIVLQLYTHQKNGALRPYMYSDMDDNTAAYGFFVLRKE